MIAFSILIDCSGNAPSPIKRLFVSIAKIIAINPSRTPIDNVPIPSQTAFPVTSAIRTHTNANTSPIRAPKSSRSTTGNSGMRDLLIKLFQEWSPLYKRDSLTAVWKAYASMTIANRSIANAHHKDSIS